MRIFIPYVCLVSCLVLACSPDDGAGPTQATNNETSPETPTYGKQSTFDEADACAPYGFVFETVETCDATTCPALTCDCELDGLTNPCTSSVGCLKEWDCDAVCENVTSAFFCAGRATRAERNLCEQDDDCARGGCEPLLNVMACLQSLPCREDGHCGEDGYCVQGFGTPTCTLGAVGDVCLDGDDCASGFCGDDQCTDGAPGALCKGDEGCASGECFYEPDQSRTTPGVCT